MNQQLPLMLRLAVALLMPSSRREEIEGDLLELLQARTTDSGAWHARWRCWHDVASVLWQRGQLRGRRDMRLLHSSAALSTTTLDALAELRYAARGLAKRPGYAAVAAFTLA